MITNHYFSSVLLDNQRWTPQKMPSIELSSYYDRVMKAGFDGVELWEFHYTNASDEEKAKLEALKIPVYNAYCSMGDEDEARRIECLEVAQKLGASSIKFNVGNDNSKWDEYQKNFSSWREKCPDDITLLCECHPGTPVEEAEDAKRFFDGVGMDKTGIIVHPYSRHESLEEWMKLFGAKVTHLHFQMRDPIDDDIFILYQERSDVAEKSLQVLKDANFNGTCCIEFTKATRTAEDFPEILFENALKDFEYLKQLEA